MVRKEKGEVNILRKMLGCVPKILYNILIIFCVLLIAIILMQRLTDSNRSIKGYKIFKVVSGSMVPKYDVGEVVICKETPVEDIKVGNAIVYRGKIGDLNGRLVMHEVIAINQDENNELKFYARGLNNSKGDPEISESQILGVVKFKSVILTLLYRLATSIYSSFIIVTILVINVFVSFKSGRVDEEPKNKKSSKDNLNKDEVQNEEKTSKTNEELQNKINELQNEIEELKSKENIEKEDEKAKNKQEVDNDKDNDNSKEKDEVVIKDTTKKNTKKSRTTQNTTEMKSTAKSKTTKKSTSNKQKKEEIVIDSKKESDKIEDVEKTKNTTKKAAKK